jgi:hypothetical protein
MENKEIKTIEIRAGVPFMANNRQYTPSETFSIGRFEKVEELEEELIQFSDKRTCHDVMLKAMAMINEFKPGDAYTLMFNKIDSDQRNAKLTHYTLRLCAAYINYEGEDIRYLTDEEISKKINDWSAEGLDVRPFVLFAVSALNELLRHYKQPIQNILEEAVEIKDALNEVLNIKTLTATADNGPDKL